MASRAKEPSCKGRANVSSAEKKKHGTTEEYQYGRGNGAPKRTGTTREARSGEVTDNGDIHE